MAAGQDDQFLGLVGGLASAYVILAEIGTDVTRFPTAGHPASRARLSR